jgi:hypothetical protein
MHAMAQQINLYDDSLRPRRLPWRAAQGLWLVAGTLAVSLVLSQGLDRWSASRRAQAEQLAGQLQQERKLLAANGGVPGGSNAERIAELDRLRKRDAEQRRVHELLDAQTARHAAGYTHYFRALSNQAMPSVWITGFAVSPDEEGLEIEGRMTDAAALPDYLRRLDQEPQFKGRRFAQLVVKSPDPHDARDEAHDGATQFQLRSVAAANTGGGLR